MKNNSGQIDSEKLFSGFVFGFLAGVMVALFKAPRIQVQTLDKTGQQIREAGTAIREKLEAAAPTDAVRDSIAEGKEAARRRRTELGLEN